MPPNKNLSSGQYILLRDRVVSYYIIMYHTNKLFVLRQVFNTYMIILYLEWNEGFFDFTIIFIFKHGRIAYKNIIQCMINMKLLYLVLNLYIFEYFINYMHLKKILIYVYCFIGCHHQITRRY